MNLRMLHKDYTFRHVILYKDCIFGSQARGTARIDRDWDILVILDKERLLPEDYDKVTFPLTMLGWDIGKEINPVMYSAKEWQKYKILGTLLTKSHKLSHTIRSGARMFRNISINPIQLIAT